MSTNIDNIIPQIGTTAAIDGEKDVSATEVFTLEDTVAYENLTPGKEYTVKGVLMDKSTGEVLLLDGKEITAEMTFTPEGSSGEVTVTFELDSRLLDTDTDIVVFESLTREGVEIAVHADLDDGGQTVHVHKPVVKTEATVDGKKEITSDGKITIEDVVSYENLTPGKEYTLYGTLMNKSTGRPFTVNGKAVHAQVKFTPETANGVVSVQFEFSAPTIFETMDVVVFESLRRDGVEVAAHADLSDDGQTIRLTPTPPETPKTGDDRNFPLWWTLSGLCFACSFGCLAFTLWDKFKAKKKGEAENDENQDRS